MRSCDEVAASGCVATPTEALNCYLKTKMDMLALGNWVLTRGAA